MCSFPFRSYFRWWAPVPQKWVPGDSYTSLLQKWLQVGAHSDVYLFNTLVHRTLQKCGHQGYMFLVGCLTTIAPTLDSPVAHIRYLCHGGSMMVRFASWTMLSSPPMLTILYNEFIFASMSLLKEGLHIRDRCFFLVPFIITMSYYEGTLVALMVPVAVCSYTLRCYLPGRLGWTHSMAMKMACFENLVFMHVSRSLLFMSAPYPCRRNPCCCVAWFRPLCVSLNAVLFRFTVALGTRQGMSHPALRELERGV